MKVQLPAVFIKPVFKVDRSVRLEFETREMSGSEVATLTDLRQSEGWLLFSPNELTITDIPDEKADSMTGRKTQAQRLRAVLYKVWESGGKGGTFEDFYQRNMETIIDKFKEKIDGGT